MSDNSLFKNSALYTIGNLLLRAFSFFLIPLYTTYLSTEDYGLINLASGFYTLASVFLTVCLQYAVVRYYADFKNEREKVARMYGTVINFILLLSVLFLPLCLLFGGIISKLFFCGISFYPIIFMSVIISIVMGLYTVYQDILKGMQLAKKSIILSYLFFFLLLAFNLLAVIAFHSGATGVLVATMCVHVMMVVIMFIDLRKHGLFELCIDRVILKELLKYSLPIVPHNIAFNVQTFATRVIINKSLSLSALGIYSLASQFGSIADVVLSSVQNAFQPWFYGEMNKQNKGTNKIIARLTYGLIWLYGFFFIVLGLYSHEAVLIMSSADYYEAWLYVPFIVLSVSLKIPLYFLINFLYYDKTKIRFLFVSTLIGCVINVFFTFVLVPNFGIYGSILADIVSLLVRFMFVGFIVKSMVVEFYSLKKLIGLSILPMLFLAVGIIPSYIVYSSSIDMQNILIKAFVVGVYVLIALFFNKSFVRGVIAKIRNI